MKHPLAIADIIKSTVPITRFNKGEASHIFDEVQSSGIKIVMKNNKPVCVLISPPQYEALIELLSDALLLEEAEKRTADAKEEDILSQKDLIRELGISPEELDVVKVEIE